jgi:cell division protein FtsW
MASPFTSASTRRRPAAEDTARRRHKPDYWLPMIAVGLLAIGLVVVYAISPGVSAQKNVSEGYYISKQLIAILLGVCAFVAMSRIPYLWWRKMVKPLLLAAALAAVLVQVLGSRDANAARWIQIGGVSFQAAELLKFVVLIWLADLLATRKQEGELSNFQKMIKPLGIAVLLILVVVGVFQSDFGSTAVMMAMIAAMTFTAGVPMKKLMIGAAIVIIGGILLISTTPYRRERLSTFMNPTRDCQNEGYQSCQALIAVGSGGMFGLGLARSVQAYGYLPEAANDSIFAILAEKFGFFGVTLIIAAYAVFFGRITKVIERAPDSFSQLVVVGILVWFSVQAAINIGAMIGLLPLKGITLPFISYGGTSLLFVTGGLGLVFQISRYSSLGRIRNGRSATNEDIVGGRGFGRSYNTATSRRA